MILEWEDSLLDQMNNMKRRDVLTTKSYGIGHKSETSVHISDFYSPEGENAREEARLKIAELSLSICELTGKPYYQSLMYKDISAFWFLEINLHEPAYLITRELAALKRIAQIYEIAEVVRDKPQRDCHVLPTIKTNELEDVGTLNRKNYFFLAIGGLFLPLILFFKALSNKCFGATIKARKRPIQVKRVATFSTSKRNYLLPLVRIFDRIRSFGRRFLPKFLRRFMILTLSNVLFVIRFILRVPKDIYCIVISGFKISWKIILKLKSLLKVIVKTPKIILHGLVKGIVAFKSLSFAIVQKIDSKFKIGLRNKISYYVNRNNNEDLVSASFLVVLEEENLRSYKSLKDSSIWSCLPYAEGIIEGLCKKTDDVMLLGRNRLKKKYPTFPLLNNALPLLQISPLNDVHSQVLESFYSIAEPFVGRYLSLKTLKEVLQYRLAEYDMYLDVLSKVNPHTLFIYNWEGVFRPLVTAARVQGRRIVGIQQALGPYLHGLNHKEIGYWTSSCENKTAFCVPDTLLVWSEYHKNNILGFGYDDSSLKVSGYCRLDRHTHLVQERKSVRRLACERLNLDPGRRYILLTAQYAVLDTCLIIKENYRDMMYVLLNLADIYGFDIIIKPWASDDMIFLKELASQDPDRVHFAPQDLILHNADLLSITELCIGTFSSIMGEATLMNNACVMLNYPESRYYFEPKYMEIYRQMAVFVDDPTSLEKAIVPLLKDEGLRCQTIQNAKEKLHYIFGSCDGKASERAIEFILNETQ